MTPEQSERLGGIKLGTGKHTSRDYGMCAMEAVAFLVGEPHSDWPTCACPAITQVMQWANDSMRREPRQTILVPLLPQVIGTVRSTATTLRRMRCFVDWCWRTYLPIWLDAAGLPGVATALRASSESTTTHAMANSWHKQRVQEALERQAAAVGLRELRAYEVTACREHATSAIATLRDLGEDGFLSGGKAKQGGVPREYATVWIDPELASVAKLMYAAAYRAMAVSVVATAGVPRNVCGTRLAEIRKTVYETIPALIMRMAADGQSETEQS